MRAMFFCFFVSASLLAGGSAKAGKVFHSDAVANNELFHQIDTRNRRLFYVGRTPKIDNWTQVRWAFQVLFANWSLDDTIPFYATSIKNLKRDFFTLDDIENNIESVFKALIFDPNTKHLIKFITPPGIEGEHSKCSIILDRELIKDFLEKNNSSDIKAAHYQQMKNHILSLSYKSMNTTYYGCQITTDEKIVSNIDNWYFGLADTDIIKYFGTPKHENVNKESWVLLHTKAGAWRLPKDGQNEEVAQYLNQPVSESNKTTIECVCIDRDILFDDSYIVKGSGTNYSQAIADAESNCHDPNSDLFGTGPFKVDIKTCRRID